jgi:hypothetical protein
MRFRYGRNVGSRVNWVTVGETRFAAGSKELLETPGGISSTSASGSIEATAIGRFVFGLGNTTNETMEEPISIHW